MKDISLLIMSALLISLAGAQEQQKPPQPSTAPTQPARMEDTPEFKALTPEQQKAILSQPDDLTLLYTFMVITKKLPSGPVPPPDLNYNDPKPAPSPAAKPCASPKPPSFLDRLKLRAEVTLAQQAQKADAKIAKGTQGNVNGAATTAAVGAGQQANQPKPCVVSPKQ